MPVENNVTVGFPRNTPKVELVYMMSAARTRTRCGGFQTLRPDSDPLTGTIRNGPCPRVERAGGRPTFDLPVVHRQD